MTVFAGRGQGKAGFPDSDGKRGGNTSVVTWKRKRRLTNAGGYAAVKKTLHTYPFSFIEGGGKKTGRCRKGTF